jgi:Dullard-like phosphatase family protein
MTSSTVDLVATESPTIAHADACPQWSTFCCLRFCARGPGGRAPFAGADSPTGRKVLVLDLDETLVHCTLVPPPEHDFKISVPLNNRMCEGYIQKRPFVDEFLGEVLKVFHVVIFTASVSQYANAVIDMICPGLPAAQRMFRENCTHVDGVLVKDLTLINRSLAEVIIVDNNPSVLMLYPDNAIMSHTWVGNRRDRELMDVIWPLLSRCAAAADVRTVLAEAKVAA